MASWVFIILGTLVAVVGVALFLGSRVPVDHVATVRTRYAAPPDSVWALFADPAQGTAWRSDLKRVTLLPPVEGKVAWEEEGKFGVIRFVMAESERPRRIVTRITNEDLPYGGLWEHVLTPSGQGTELATTERGFIKPAFFRFMSRYFFGYTQTIETVHRALGAKLGETVTPEVTASGR